MYDENMAQSFVITVIKYPNIPVEVAASDACRLREALEKQFEKKDLFKIEVERDTAKVVSKNNLDLTFKNEILAFSRGFMASAHLWER